MTLAAAVITAQATVEWPTLHLSYSESLSPVLHVNSERNDLSFFGGGLPKLMLYHLKLSTVFVTSSTHHVEETSLYQEPMRSTQRKTMNRNRRWMHLWSLWDLFQLWTYKSHDAVNISAGMFSTNRRVLITINSNGLLII